MIGRSPASPTADGGRLRILDGCDGEVLADVPASLARTTTPRSTTGPAGRPPRRGRPDRRRARRLPDADRRGADLLATAAPTPRGCRRQYDHQLFLNTVEGPGGDAAVLRLKHPTTGVDTGRGLALTTDGNHRWCAVDPRLGTALTVAESVLNLACVGARPLAVVNCLNFGNPEHPEVMWQLSEAIDGMAEACRAFGIPVVGGNVSLYNETAGADIDPTPVVGVLGVVDRLDRRPPGVGLVDGQPPRAPRRRPSAELAGSPWARRQGHRGGALARRSTCSPHQASPTWCASSSPADASSRRARRRPTAGSAWRWPRWRCGPGSASTRPASRDAAALFSESPSRVVVCVAARRAAARARARAAAPASRPARIGVAGGDRLSSRACSTWPLAEAIAAWRDRLPAALGAGTTQG